MKFYKFSFFLLILALILLFANGCKQKDKTVNAYNTLSTAVEVMNLPGQEKNELPYSFQEGISAYMESGRWGYIDKQGNVLIKAQYDSALSFFDGLAAVQKNDLWGYIDHSGKEVISVQFTDASVFWNDVASVNNGENWFLIDKSGNPVKDFNYTLTGQSNPIYFWSGYAIYQEGALFGYVDREGKSVIPSQFLEAGSMSEGFAFVTLDDAAESVICIDKNGERAFQDWVLVQPYPSYFQDGLALIAVADSTPDGKSIVVDTNGEIIFQFPKEKGKPLSLSEGLIFYSDATTKKQGALDLRGKEILPPVLDDIGDSVDGVIDVYIDNDVPIYIKNPVWPG